MAQIEQAQTVGAVSADVVALEIPVGVTAHEIHFSGDDPSSGDCVTGDCHLSIKRQSGGSPVVKACTTDIWHNDFAVMVSLTATVVGDEVVISVPGIVGKTINWVVTSGV